MERITKFIFYLFAFILPYGSVNPFDLSAVYAVSNENTEQSGIGPYIFALCIILAGIDRKVWSNYEYVYKFIVPLFGLFCAMFCSTVLYDQLGVPFPYSFLVKLFVAEIGFYIISLYFIQYPKVISYSLTIYAYSCAFIVVSFFAGFLEDMYFISNGRLWLFGENPNNFSFMMGLGAIILVNNIISVHKSKIILVVNILSVIAILLYVLLSGSRGSLLICLFVIIALSYKVLLKKVVFLILLLLIVTSIGISYISTKQDNVIIFERIADLQGGDDDREKLLSDAWSLFEDSPVLGWGRNGYVTERSIRFVEDRDSHNMLLSVGVMSGIIGLLGLLLFLFRIGSNCLKCVHDDFFPMAFFLYVFLISMKTGDVITFAMMWYCYAMIYAMSLQTIGMNNDVECDD